MVKERVYRYIPTQKSKYLERRIELEKQLEKPHKKSKYSQTERNQCKSLLFLYYESNLQNPNDELHELMLEFLSKQGIHESSRAFLKEKRDLVQELEKVRNDLAKYQNKEKGARLND